MKEIEITYPQKIKDIKFIESEFKGVNKSFERISLILDFQQIDLYPIDDTDEIGIEISDINDYTVNKDAKFISHFIGKNIFTTWKCINSQGYFDLFIIGIEAIKPTILILSEGSSLKVMVANQIGLENIEKEV